MEGHERMGLGMLIDKPRTIYLSKVHLMSSPSSFQPWHNLPYRLLDVPVTRVKIQKVEIVCALLSAIEMALNMAEWRGNGRAIVGL